jgi:hypothetical protein
MILVTLDKILYWWPDLLDVLIQRVSTLYSSLLHTLVSTVTSSLSLLGSGFQRRTFPFPMVPERSPASVTSFSQQQLATTESQQFSDWLTSQSQIKSLSYVMTDGHSVSLFWCQVASGAQDQIFVTVRQLWVCWCGAPSLTRWRVCRLKFMLALASAVIFTAVKISVTCHLYLQFFMSAFYIGSCQDSGYLWTPTIYSFTCKSSV